MKNKLPGLYLLAGKHLDTQGFQRCGAFAVREVPGALVSVSETEKIWLGIDGILTGIDRCTGEKDADAALRLYQNQGIKALSELSGYFTLLLIEKEPGQTWVISDLLASRPYYIYKHNGMVSTGPDAAFARRLRLPVTLDRQVLYQMFRINHPLGGRCLAREIERTRPFTKYNISSDGSIQRKAPSHIEQEPDPQLTLDSAADQMHEAASQAVDAILKHPLARSRKLELPLTAGYDSRHLLGELLALRRPPDRIRHVRVDEADYFPVAEMCNDLDLDLHAPRFEEIDQTDLLRIWLHNTAGQVHLHQLYLFGVRPDAESSSVLGLTAYLSGLLFSYSPLGTPINRRHYTRTGLGLLFPDRGRQAREFKNRVETELNFFKGEEAFRIISTDAVNRSPRYAGAAFTELGDNAIYFPPAADRATWEWFRRMPASLAWRQKARIRMFERHFPQLGCYPTRNGFPLIRPHSKDNIPSTSSPKQKLRRKKYPHNPIPPTPHAWLRAHPTLRNLTERVVSESKLCEDGQISRAVVQFLWKTHQYGAFNGWALMSLVTTEAAYRMLILGEAPDTVTDWLTA